MNLRRWGRGLAVVLAAVLCGALLLYAYHRVMPTRFLVDAKLAVLPTRSVLVLQEVIGSSLSTGQSLRFDFIDPGSGERLKRTPAPFNLDAARVAFLGGSVRQWWGDSAEVVLLDVGSGSLVGTEEDILARNAILRGELHPGPERERFDVDVDGALLVWGGDGLGYSIDSITLRARALSGPPPRLWRGVEDWRLPRMVSESYHFATRQASPGAAAAASGLMLACRTASAGPCTLRSQSEQGMVWQLGDDVLNGMSVLALEAREEGVGYVYIADDSTLSFLYGGAWLYAVELATGRVLWTEKL